MLDGLVGATVQPRDLAEVVERVGVLGVDPEALGQVGLRPCWVTFAEGDEREAVAGVLCLGGFPREGLEEPLGLVEPTAFQECACFVDRRTHRSVWGSMQARSSPLVSVDDA